MFISIIGNLKSITCNRETFWENLKSMQQANKCMMQVYVRLPRPTSDTVCTHRYCHKELVGSEVDYRHKKQPRANSYLDS